MVGPFSSIPGGPTKWVERVMEQDLLDPTGKIQSSWYKNVRSFCRVNGLFSWFSSSDYEKMNKDLLPPKLRGGTWEDVTWLRCWRLRTSRSSNIWDSWWFILCAAHWKGIHEDNMGSTLEELRVWIWWAMVLVSLWGLVYYFLCNTLLFSVIQSVTLYLASILPPDLTTSKANKLWWTLGYIHWSWDSLSGTSVTANVLVHVAISKQGS